MVTPGEIARAAHALRAGELVAFPTETVYGLGADAANAKAVQRLYAVKRRPLDHPVIVHIANVQELDDFARDIPDVARALAAAFWPGPLTLVVNRDPDRVTPEVTGGRDTVGLRVPDHPIALALLDAFGGGLAAPSANRFGKVSPTTADHVRADLDGDVAVVLDGGPCRVGIESTIVDVSGGEPAILRIGGASRAEIERVAGVNVELRTSGEQAAPGTLASHYAPVAIVEIVEPREIAERADKLLSAGHSVGVLAMLHHAEAIPEPALPLGRPEPAERFVVLDPPRDLHEYARVLYARLRDADRLGLDVLLVVAPPDTDGPGAAIADRIRRAAD